MAAPLVKRVHEDFKARGVALVAISTTAEKEQLEVYAKDHATSGVYLHDPAAEEKAVGYERYGITGFPSFIIVDGARRVSESWKHYQEGPSEVRFRAALTRALDRPGKPPSSRR